MCENMKKFFLTAVGIFWLVPLVFQTEVWAVDHVIWENSLLVNSRFKSDEGSKLNIMGYGLTSGDILIEIDESSQSITSLTGTMRGLNASAFTYLEKSIRKQAPEHRFIETQEVFSARTGKADFVLNLDLQKLGRSFDADVMREIKGASDLNLSLERMVGRTGRPFIGLILTMHREAGEQAEGHKRLLLYPISVSR